MHSRGSFLSFSLRSLFSLLSRSPARPQRYDPVTSSRLGPDKHYVFAPEPGAVVIGPQQPSDFCAGEVCCHEDRRGGGACCAEAALSEMLAFPSARGGFPMQPIGWQRFDDFIGYQWALNWTFGKPLADPFVTMGMGLPSRPRQSVELSHWLATHGGTVGLAGMPIWRCGR